MHHATVLLLAASLAGLSGCAARPPASSAAPPGPPAGAEGRYRGTARLVRSESRFCPRSGPRVYELERGAVELAYSTPVRTGARPDRVQLSAPIQQDGTVKASDGVGTIDGQLRNGLLEITIASATCEHRWTLRKVQ